MFEKNTKAVNQILSKVYAVCSIVILALTFLSVLGVFEFGKKYTTILLFAGLIVSVSPGILIHFVSDNVMKYYTLMITAVFIGVLGTNNHIGIYITFVLVPVFSCLYFDIKLLKQMSIFSYLIMALSVYINSAGKYEVAYMHRSRLSIYIAYLIGFTIEYAIIDLLLCMIVKRAKKMMEARYIAEKENEKKSRFLSNMSHEIRTPMNAIIGMTDVALRTEMDDELRKYFSIIRSSSLGLLQIVNDILDLSKIEAGKMQVMSEAYETKSLFEDIQAIINARNIHKKIPIHYHISGNIPKYLEGDAGRIRQVMLNYASNAIKYTDQGRIDISLKCEPFKEGYVSLIFSVKDTGQGIRQEDMGKLFTMYSRLNPDLNNKIEGTGIGLAINKYFVEHMNGYVSAQSEYGKGSTFSFSIPQKIIQRKESLPETDPEITNPFTTQNVKILLVDDNEINREVLKAVLEPLQLTIDEAENGRIAVEMAQKQAYDIILMDSHMPVMDGEEATRKIRSQDECINQKIPIIALTADAISGVREHLLSIGMDDYVVKPIDSKIMFQIIEKYLPSDKIIKK